jgi:glyoxalase family protein
VRLEGIHHITAITGDAQRNLDFYVGLLGLRFVKKTVNFDAPDVYHLYYGDELGHPGSILTFFEFPHAAPGRPAAGDIHRIIWRVADASSLDFWDERLAAAGVETTRGDGALTFADPEGLELELVVDESGEPPLSAPADDIPVPHALRGFQGVRAYASSPGASRSLLQAIGFDPADDRNYVLRGTERSAGYHFDPPPGGRRVQGAGSVHHIAWAAQTGEHEAWRERVIEAGARPTPVIDRTYFRSIYFREPSGVLFEIATLDPGFTIDEDESRLGEALRLPPQHEHMRELLEEKLTPLRNPRVGDGARVT